MTRILRIINRFNIGGPTYNATFLSRFMDEEFETLLIGGLPEEDENDSLYIPEEYGLQPLLIPEMKRKPNFKSDRIAYKKLKEIIREFKPDIVHTHASKAGALGRKAAKKCNVPVIVHTFHGHVFHSYFNQLKTFAYKTAERQLAKYSTGIIAISERQKFELSEIHKICPAEKISVIPLGFDLSRFYENKEQNRITTRNTWNIKEDEIAIAIIGRLAPVKNHNLFLNALQTVVHKSTRKLKVFIVGDGGEKAELMAKVKSEFGDFADSIIFTSWIPQIAAFNHGMDLICLSSLNEGTPVSLIEAQAAGVPVVTTDVGGVRDVVQDKETGLIVSGNDPDSFAAAMLELIENEKKRLIMSQNGRKFVEDKFHYQRLVNDMKQYYRKLLENHAPK